MKNDLKQDVEEWLRIVEMDRTTAYHLFKTMRPKPLEIICLPRLFDTLTILISMKSLQKRRWPIWMS